MLPYQRLTAVSKYSSGKLAADISRAPHLFSHAKAKALRGICVWSPNLSVSTIDWLSRSSGRSIVAATCF